MASHETLLRRGRRHWNFAAVTYYGLMERLAGGRLWEMARSHLALSAGERVLDIGCGTGTMLAALRREVGAAGRVVGVDNSPRMADRSRRRVRAHGWSNVEVRWADASRVPHGDAEFDAALASTSISAMPDVATAVRLAHDALRPGGRLFVFDMRLVGDAPRTRIARGIYRATAGFTGADVLTELRHTFGAVELLVPEHPMMTIVLATRTSDRPANAGGVAGAASVAAAPRKPQTAGQHEC